MDWRPVTQQMMNDYKGENFIHYIREIEIVNLRSHDVEKLGIANSRNT